jgi:ssDNA-binding Zn-finger/Zn-ribbon topoisomerase 1
MEENKDYQNVEVLREGGLQCDNPKCDYTNTDIAFEDYKDWIDVPCPECGENLLTEGDYGRALALRETIKMINSIPPEMLESFSKTLPPEALEEFKKTGFFKDAEGIENINEDTESITIKVSSHEKLKAVEVKDTTNKEEE